MSDETTYAPVGTLVKRMRPALSMTTALWTGNAAFYREASMHRAFLIAHRWLALVAAVFLAVVAVSGGLLVLEGPVARARQPHVVPAGSPLPLDTLVMRARATAGGGDVMMMGLGDSPDLAWAVVLSSGGGSNVLVNPYTGAILTSPPGRDPLVAFMRKVHLLHTQLLG